MKNDRTHNQILPEMGKRTLKVYSKYFTRCKVPLILPEIRLAGIWLKKLGFENGQNIKVITEQNRIIIRNSEKIVISL